VTARPSTEQRFRNAFWVSETGCWNWTGYTRLGTRGPYPIFRADGKSSVHVRNWAYARFRGEAYGRKPQLLCGSPLCVNPWHLELSIQRKPSTRRYPTNTHCSRLHPMEKANVFYTSTGYRCCRECRREYDHRRRWERRGLEPPPYYPRVEADPPEHVL